MNVLLPLLRIYREAGFQVRTGCNPAHFRNDPNAPYTLLFKDGRRLSTGGGISLQEVFFFQCLFEVLHPQRIFGVGNAFGFSTVMLALLNPSAKVVVLDNGVEGGDARAGIDLTNGIAEKERLNIHVVFGASPQDTAACIRDHLGGSADFVFIDGLHTIEQQEKDYAAVLPFASPECVFAFHDLVSCNLLPGFQQLAGRSNQSARLLLRTTSGVGVISPPALEEQIGESLNAFCQTWYEYWWP